MKVLIVAGASGGHIYPALAFLGRLKAEKKVSDLLLVLPSRSVRFGLNDLNCKVRYISSGRLYFSLSRKNIFAFLAFAKGAWESLRIFFKFKPDAVIGFGSIDSIFLVMIAWFFRVKTIIHEQNVLPGKANRFLSRFADKVAISFPQSYCYLNLPKDKVSLTGNPIRGNLEQMEKKESRAGLGLDKDKFTILVMGGSQGSERINCCFIKALRLIKGKQALQFIHITGKEEYEKIMQEYKGLDIKGRIFNFLKEMGAVYSAADLAITRAGATTISELIYFSLPAILVPYPFAYAHQLDNAKFLEERSAGIIINDGELNPDNLSGLIEDLASAPEKISMMRRQYSGIPKYDASLNLFKILEDLLYLNENDI